MSMDTIMEEDDSSLSNTDAIIYGSYDISARTESLISDPNIPNSSSTNEHDHHQQILVAAGGGVSEEASPKLIDTRRIHGMDPQYVVQCSYYPENHAPVSSYETCPDFQFAHSVTTGPLPIPMDPYVIDFIFNQVLLQWRALMQGLAFRPGGPSASWRTGIGLSKPNDTVALQDIGIVVNPLSDDDVDATIWNIRPSNVEAMAVHSVFEIHHMLSRPSPIEKLLNSVKEMQPQIVTTIEQEANHKNN
ncbi:hypothetical protein RND71_028560 [Anisodus tanguticus]|uniref:Uncharacterized protein n=1 Tax=Anisodus tanguticus TaxID=243964 RepID=A0AAE1RLN8_9SOLA|nr:hypothetical protein RND71_028560 [Anisodus tanguticus]